LHDDSEQVNEISQNYLSKRPSKLTVPRVAQFVILEVLRIAFGMDRGTVFRLFTSQQAGLVRDIVASLTRRFPGLSSVHRCARRIAREEVKIIVALAGELQDKFAIAVGTAAQTAYGDLLASRTKTMAPAECYIGIVPPSNAFPSLDPAKRGYLMLFLNAWTYIHAKRISGVMALLGELKRPEITRQEVCFPLAGELGFYDSSPGKNAVYHAFQQIEAYSADIDAIASEQLASGGSVYPLGLVWDSFLLCW
jgi:hypothetical protein